MQMEDVAVTAVRTTPYNAVQVGIKTRKEKNTHNALLGQFRKNGVAPKLRMAEFRISDDAMIQPGESFYINYWPMPEPCLEQGPS